ncbi:hypothetical protein NEPAR06_0816 [Nematocida parisii]|uniref:GRAM domain-containing protein n=1 Tax=Nematocida parisii (strain ERTm3) TaxID=935791 RepID=I3EEK7_NEMP3|nr:uncharacterized protein NEPG_02281 [Nematocida parisii ERTm1]EIJ87654.1 hypothetical protein NEQG_02201 [Nematocida parisii ERTm3]KAI5129004.1 hypothetical protein NEPAR08_1438 [Nematocida parisii]EIJ92882.1 hypothetical protein NEPG_02281 [Nematocida parisii ERTm1]KAI5129167.1 hypothetical protein NEPAR03_1567 [Nematocida parisii]KAI5142061.1 hypothetical protein NEPAR04_1417 [Nematocida parisii]|eukprot:XP_013060108.1 hypothetical protein NEPG_02281 [Nematocida parisii ERTm1]
MSETGTKKTLPSEKRKEKFHSLFKSIPKNEELKHSCPSLLKNNSKYFQGRLYISTEHLSFYSKNIFGNTTIILKLKTILGVELKKSLFLTGSLEITTYDKTYSFKSLFYKEELYPIILHQWQRVIGVLGPKNSTNYGYNSIFKINIPRPHEVVEESSVSKEERVFDINMRMLLRRMVNTGITRKFYSTLTNDTIFINTYINRRTIQFYNEYIDEIYSVTGNTLDIEYHSKGTLCRIRITPENKHQVRVRIVEKYNYTTIHYYKYIELLCNDQKSYITDRLLIGTVFTGIFFRLIKALCQLIRLIKK